MKRFILGITLILILTTWGCTPAAPAPTTTALPSTSTATELPPTPTKLPDTSTPEPTKEPTSTPEPESAMGTPIPEWEGVPIIPGANEGTPAGFGYIYSANVSIEEAETFYLEQMENNGWILTNHQTSETSLFGGPSTSLDFQKGGKGFNVMLIFSDEENYTMVMLTALDP